MRIVIAPVILVARASRPCLCILLAALAAGLTGATPVPRKGPVAIAEAAPGAKPVSVIRIEALIDGRSQLLLKGKTAQWLNLEHAAPGRHDDTKMPTVLNGKEWFPEWPDEKGEENRDCKCKSDKYEELEPAAPEVLVKAEIKIVQGRGKVKIVQLPNAENDHVMIVEFDDNGQAGHNPYVVELRWPEEGER